MAAVKRDYYEVLGIPREADEETIRRAFQTLAREWHPQSAEPTEAEARFRELAEAYTVLSKRESRALYDRYGYRARSTENLDEALSEIAGAPEAVRGDDVQLELDLRSYEAAEGTKRVVAFAAQIRCPTCMGRGTIGLPDPDCEFCSGTGRKRSALGAYFDHLPEYEDCPACISEPCPNCGERGTVESERRIRVRIPAGVEDGMQLRVAGDGNDAGAGSVPGDLLVRVHVPSPPRDARWVRLAALALLVVAVAALAFYVVH